MAFTTSSTIESVRLTFTQGDNRVTSIFVIFDGTNPSPTHFSIPFSNNYTASGSTEQGWLTTLQSIYGSSDGIENVDGDSVTPTVESFPFGTTVESLVEAWLLESFRR